MTARHPTRRDPNPKGYFTYGRCPACGKKGLGQFEPTQWHAVLRTCRYCQHVEVERTNEEAR